MQFAHFPASGRPIDGHSGMSQPARKVPRSRWVRDDRPDERRVVNISGSDALRIAQRYRLRRRRSRREAVHDPRSTLASGIVVVPRNTRLNFRCPHALVGAAGASRVECGGRTAKRLSQEPAHRRFVIDHEHIDDIVFLSARTGACCNGGNDRQAVGCLQGDDREPAVLNRSMGVQPAP